MFRSRKLLSFALLNRDTITLPCLQRRFRAKLFHPKSPNKSLMRKRNFWCFLIYTKAKRRRKYRAIEREKQEAKQIFQASDSFHQTQEGGKKEIFLDRPKRGGDGERERENRQLIRETLLLRANLRFGWNQSHNKSTSRKFISVFSFAKYLHRDGAQPYRRFQSMLKRGAMHKLLTCFFLFLSFIHSFVYSLLFMSDLHCIDRKNGGSWDVFGELRSTQQHLTYFAEWPLNKIINANPKHFPVLNKQMLIKQSINYITCGRKSATKVVRSTSNMNFN